jgi:peptidoglycan DL-endopeptidase LytE
VLDINLMLLVKRSQRGRIMRKCLEVSGVCLLLLLFLSGQAYSHGHSRTKVSKKAAKEHRLSAGKLKAQKKSKSVSLSSSRRLAVLEEEPVQLKTTRGRKADRRSRPIAVVEQSPNEANDNDEYVEYKVRRGDTLEKLAQRFNIEKEEITDLNKAAKRRLKPGTVVFIPRTQDEPETEPVVLNDRPIRPWKSEEERGILVKVAKSFSGAPYRFGGDSVRGLDCSAFVKKMYEIFEVQLPRCAREQFYAGPKVTKEDLLTGDLVFFKTMRYAKYPTHVGIYIGDGKFIHASSLLKRGVKVDRLSDSYFSRTYTGAVRVKAPPEAENSETK